MYFLSPFCCVCAKSKIKLINTATSDGHGIKFSEKLKFCMPLIDDKDGCLNFICQRCLSNLNTTFDFINRCAKTNSLLQYYKSKFNVSNENSKYGELSVSVLDLDNKEMKIMSDDYKFDGCLHENCTTSDNGSIENKCLSIYRIFSNENVYHEQISNSLVPYTRKKKLEDLLMKRQLRSFKTETDLYVNYYPTQQLFISPNKVEKNHRYVKLKILKKRRNRDKLKLKLSNKTAKNNSFSCMVCDKILPNRKSLQKHLYAHVDNSLQCTICRRKFSQRWKVTRHLLTHLRAQQFKCNSCEFQSSYRTNLQRHLRSCVGNPQKPNIITLDIYKKSIKPIKRKAIVCVDKKPPITLNSTHESTEKVHPPNLSYRESQLIFLQLLDLQNTQEFKMNDEMYLLRSKTQMTNVSNRFIMPENHLYARNNYGGDLVLDLTLQNVKHCQVTLENINGTFEKFPIKN